MNTFIFFFLGILGQVTREVLRSALEEADEAGNSSIFATLASSLMKIEVAKGNYWKTAINPYGSEFSYVSVREVSFFGSLSRFQSCRCSGSQHHVKNDLYAFF